MARGSEMTDLQNTLDDITALERGRSYGRVADVQGLLIRASGIGQLVSVGSRCLIDTRSGEPLLAEVVGFKDGQSLLMPYGALEGVGVDCRVWVVGQLCMPSPGKLMIDGWVRIPKVKDLRSGQHGSRR